MINTGFEIYGKHLYKDFNCYIDEADTTPPEPNQITVEVPFMQGVYDFTNIFSETTYPNRKLTYYIDVVENDSKNLAITKIILENWLLGKQRDVLKDDRLIGYYYLAKCISIKENDDAEYTRLEITFTAYPFKVKKWNEGECLWDEFCFLTDYMQKTKFEINEAKQISLFNFGSKNIIPTIVSNSNMKIIKNNIEYAISLGQTKDYRIELEKGENVFTIVGKGTIEFQFKIEVL